jgi:hypothetical protein
MKYLWPLLLVALRALYFAYSIWCLLFPLAAMAVLSALWQDHPLLGLRAGFWQLAILAALLLFATTLLALVYRRRAPDDPNPFQSAFLSWFDTLRGFWNARPGDMVRIRLPSGYLVENPQAYRIGGAELQEILNCIRPGDILLRGFDGYVDGMLIRRASVCCENGFRPGWFTHAALYLGALTEDDRRHVPPAFQAQAEFFQTSAQMVVHAMAKGVHCQDLLTFCRSDYLTVVPGALQIDVDAAVHAARICALEQIGDSYDFDASDTQAFTRYSCSELVFYCLRGIQSQLQLAALPHALFPLYPLSQTFAVLKRVTIVPDYFYDLVGRGALACVWQDHMSAQRLPGGGGTRAV